MTLPATEDRHSLPEDKVDQSTPHDFYQGLLNATQHSIDITT